MGIRKARDIALPAYLSSVYSVAPLVEAVLSHINVLAETNGISDAVDTWKELYDVNVPEDPEKVKQREWDVAPGIVFRDLLANGHQTVRARLLAASQRESGLWLHAVPVPSLGTQLDPDTLRIAVALRVGSPVCEPHICRCGQGMDAHGLHGLSCRYSAGRHPRHAALNDVVKRALQSAGLPSVLEPVGIDRGDGKRPDGITVFPYKTGKSLCWDCTCVDTFANTSLNQSTLLAGSAATAAKYAALAERYLF